MSDESKKSEETKESVKSDVSSKDAQKPKEEGVGKLSAKEEEQIKVLRAMTEKRKECALEIDGILKKYNAVLTIDPNSPFGNPQIIVSLR